MKALTICQPYAELIATGEKLVENRTWFTNHRGELAIHAGRSRKFLGTDDDPIDVTALTFGAIVAIAKLVDVVPIDKLPAHLKGHPHARGPVCWILTDVERLHVPWPIKGAQGLWEWNP